MYNTWFGTVSQNKPTEIIITPIIRLKSVYSGTSFLTDVSMYWDGNTGDACDTIYYDVSSNVAWTATTGGQWSLSTSSGGAGVTNCSASYSPDIMPEEFTYQFQVSSVTYARLHMRAESGCA